ncbi:MAG: hypothetical protein V2A78_03520 [bacterium]
MQEYFDEKINLDERVAFWKVLEELGKRIGHGQITIQIYDDRVEDLNITFASKPLKFPEGFNRMMEHIGMEDFVEKKKPDRNK